MGDVTITIIQPSGTTVEAEVPNDVLVGELIWDIVFELRLPRSRSDGSTARYRLHSEKLGRSLDYIETFESAGISQDDKILITPVAIAGDPDLLGDVTIRIIQPSGTTVEAEVPSDVPLGELISDIVSELRLPRSSSDGSTIRYRLHSETLGRSLDDSETFESAGIPQDDKILIAPVVIAGGPDLLIQSLTAIATAMASGVIGNVAYDAIKAVSRRVKSKVGKTQAPLAPSNIELLALAAVISRCDALGWPLPDASKMHLVRTDESQFTNGTMYHITISCEEPDMRATVIIPKEQLSTFGAAVTLQRPGGALD
jgi:hypothetical protein